MSTLSFSHHAQTRMHHRALSSTVAEWLYDYGERRYDHKGCLVFFFTNRSRQRLKQALGGEKALSYEKTKDAYMVMSVEGRHVVTLGYRYQRIKCDPRPFGRVYQA